MMCMGHYEIKPPIYIFEKFIKNKRSICTNNILENEFMYLY